jgi:hypothetical protein
LREVYVKVPRITLDPLWLALPTLLTLLYVGSLVQYPLDFWHNATTGRLIVASGTIPDRDTFTHTIAGQPVVNQSWLAEWAIYELFRVGGFPLVQFVAAICYATAIAVTTAGAWCRCRSARIAAVLAMASLGLAISNFGVRTQAVSFVLFAVELFALWQWPSRWWTVLIVGAAETIWTNTHGAFPLGIVLPGLFLTATIWVNWRREGLKALFDDRSVRMLSVCVIVALATAFCNPHPSRTLSYVFCLTSRASQRSIGEWQPTHLDTYTGAAMLASVLAAAAILAIGRKRPQAIELFLLLAFGGLALGAQRMVVWWAMVVAPVLAPHLAAALARRLSPSQRSEGQPAHVSSGRESGEEGWQQMLNWAMLLVLGLAVLMSTPWTRAYNPLLPPGKRQAHSDDEPWRMVEFLQQSAYRGRTFNSMEWGAYLTWHFDPALKVFIDSRIDFFPKRVWDDYVRIGNADPGWQELLDQYQVELVVWNRQLSDKLPTALTQSAHWKNVYQDPLATVFVRIGSAVP